MYMQNERSVILASLPVDRNFKHLLCKKFDHLQEYNGKKYASDVFSSARVLLLRYLSGEISYETFLNEQRISKSWFKDIEHCIRSNPHVYLDLLKLYTGFDKPVQTVEQSEQSMSERLSRRLSDSANEFLRGAVAELCKASSDSCTSRERKHLAWSYHNSEGLLPVPENYKDAVGAYSQQYAVDIEDFGILAKVPQLAQVCQPILDKTVLEYDTDFDIRDYLECLPYIGQIHHIPKKGTVKRRPIAVPNRFVQAGFEPLAVLCRRTLEFFYGEHDATYDQSRFDTLIQAKLDKGEYVGAVDLSAASDNLPRRIAIDVMSGLFSDDPIIANALSAFDYICQMEWRNGTRSVQFNIGQPLGTFPSFPLLALTNHMIADLARAELDKTSGLHWVILGDDIVFFDRDIQQRYMSIMEKLEVPLSLHKCYNGRLTEFAGKVYIKGQVPRYTPDHLTIVKSNLFDYQKASGIPISWRNLPKAIKRWWRGDLSEAEAIRSYTLVQALLLPSVLPCDAEALGYLISLLEDKEDKSPDTNRDSRIVPLSDYTMIATANSDGLTRPSNRMVPDWFQKKFRPYSSKRLRDLSRRALSECKKTITVQL